MTRRELTSFNNKPSNRDYNNSQHNNYNKDYSSYRNYSSNSSGAGNYHQQSNSGQPNAHHRAYANAGNLTNSGNPIGKGNHSHSLSGASTLGANRPPEANLAKAAQQQSASIGSAGGVGQHPQSVHRSNSSERSSSPQIGDCFANSDSNDKLFSKWVPPSVNSRSENLTPDDRNNIVFRRVRG